MGWAGLGLAIRAKPNAPETGSPKQAKNDVVSRPKTARLNPIKEKPLESLGTAHTNGLAWGWAWLGWLGWAGLTWVGLGLGLGWANPSRQGNTAARRPQTSQKSTKNDAVAGPKTARLNPAKEKLLAELWQGPHQWAALGLGLASLARLGWTGLGYWVVGGCAGHGAGLGLGWGQRRQSRYSAASNLRKTQNEAPEPPLKTGKRSTAAPNGPKTHRKRNRLGAENDASESSR